jgi:uncharacterized protein HemX
MGAPLVRAAATTAVVAGTAGAVQHHQQMKYQGQAQAQQASSQQAQMAAEMDAMQQQQAALAQQQAMLAQQQAQAPAAPAQPDLTTQLNQLAQLQQQGLITAEEYAAKKKQLLGI